MQSSARKLVLVQQMLRFASVGVVAACVHFCCVIFLVQMGWLTPLIANIFAFIIAFQLSYWGHRLWTFTGSSVLHKIALPKLLFIQCNVLLISEFIFYIFLSYGIPYQIALFITLTILPVLTFVSNKFWVFR